MILVRNYLKKHEWKEDFSFIAQSGVYTENEPKKKKRVIPEQSVQIVLFKADAGSGPDFRKIVSGLTYHILRRMGQKSVLVEYQENGISLNVWNYTLPVKKKK